MMKKPQQVSSPDVSIDSPDGTNMNELGDAELPNLNPLCPSSNFILHPLLQEYHHDLNTNPVIDSTLSHCSSPDLNLNINWLGGGGGGGGGFSDASGSSSLSSWPPSLLCSSLNTTVNSLLLKALQIKSHQVREATNIDIHNLLPQLVGQYPSGATFDSTSTTTTTIPISSSATTMDNNSIMNLVCASSQQQQQQNQHRVQSKEQPFNMDSFW